MRMATRNPRLRRWPVPTRIERAYRRLSCAALLLVAGALPLDSTSARAEPLASAHGGPVTALDAAAGRWLSGGFDYALRLWRNSTPQARLIGHEAAVNAAAFVDETRALSVGDDGALILWDLPSAAPLSRQSAHQGRATALAIHPDRRHAVSGGWDGHARLWRLDSAAPQPQALRTISVGARIDAAAFDETGTTVYLAGADGTVRGYRTADATQTISLSGHGLPINALAVLPDERLASASADETIRVWSLDDGATEATLYGHVGPVLCLAASADGAWLASGGIDGRVILWRLDDWAKFTGAVSLDGPVWSLAFAGDSVLAGDAQGRVQRWRLDELQAPPATTIEPPSADEVAPASAAAAPRSRGARLFATCAPCHSLTPESGNKAGPSLYGLFGREAGEVADYAYSSALAASNIVWTEATVAALFEHGPHVYTPGSKMPLQRLPHAGDRRALVAYLKTVTRPNEAPKSGE